MWVKRVFLGGGLSWGFPRNWVLSEFGGFLLPSLAGLKVSK